MTHPGAPRDVDLAQWLDGIGFKPANTERKQLGHEVARQLVGEVGGLLHDLLPAGRDKSLTFTLLEDVLMRANRALALGNGPQEHLTTEFLRDQATSGAQLPADPRIDEYKADQRSRGPESEVATGNQLYGEAYAQDPLPDDDLRSTHATIHTNDPEITVEVTGSRSSRVVQVAVLGTRERIQTAIGEMGGNFTGLYASINDPSELSGLLRKISEAGEVAFRDAG